MRSEGVPLKEFRVLGTETLSCYSHIGRVPHNRLALHLCSGK